MRGVNHKIIGLLKVLLPVEIAGLLNCPTYHHDFQHDYDNDE